MTTPSFELLFVVVPVAPGRMVGNAEVVPDIVDRVLEILHVDDHRRLPFLKDHAEGRDKDMLERQDRQRYPAVAVDEPRYVDAAQRHDDPLGEAVIMELLSEAGDHQQDKDNGVQPVFDDPERPEPFDIFVFAHGSLLMLSVYRVSPQVENDLKQQPDYHKGDEERVSQIDHENQGRLLEVRLIMGDPAVREIRRCPGMAFLTAFNEVLLDDRGICRSYLGDVMDSVAVDADGDLFLRLPVLPVEFHRYAVEILQIGVDDLCGKAVFLHDLFFRMASGAGLGDGNPEIRVRARVIVRPVASSISAS
jgi:hypothetical protein